MPELNDIQPGVNYPSCVIITEKLSQRKRAPMMVKFLLTSYAVGMYCAVYLNGELARQAGDHDNKKFVAKLKKDIANAYRRKATVEIGALQPVCEAP